MFSYPVSMCGGSNPFEVIFANLALLIGTVNSFRKFLNPSGISSRIIFTFESSSAKTDSESNSGVEEFSFCIRLIP